MSCCYVMLCLDTLHLWLGKLDYLPKLCRICTVLYLVFPRVCEKLAAQLHHQVENKRAEVEPKKISEYQIIEITENVCNLKKAEVDWILLIDIVEQGDKLQLLLALETTLNVWFQIFHWLLFCDIASCLFL
ncbi:hypothetical protein RchiOBHm_Chr5g0016971 [Rosa chinensis]|uniref:Uncharacterized protein n=1 Tax=Rosa chinensis TaxID=74649 RepID=A0A2P6Q6D1_ROSCH|nr:hypothetical protein RchiOBHm_Chr5g0016971 [Rosa chinensis]